MPDAPAVNASPLIFLAKADRLGLLQVVAPEVVVPRAVFDEVTAYGEADPVCRRVMATVWLRVIDCATVPPVIQNWDLGPGESAVLTYGLAHRGVECVMDDLAGRRCAEVLGIPVLGTLGLVVRAKRRGLIPMAKPVVEELLGHGMYVSVSVVAKVMAVIGE